jgi:hypothetical protein
MPRSSATQRRLAPWTHTSFYPDDLLCDIQAALAALADIEVQYRVDQEHLQAWAGPEAIKERFAAQIEDRYQRERGLYDQRLIALRDQMLAAMGSQDGCGTG